MSLEFERHAFIDMLHEIKPANCFIDSSVEYLIRFENLNEGFRHACRKIGIPKVDLPHINRSSRDRYQEYYDDELVDIVRGRFKHDIELGEYEFDD